VGRAVIAPGHVVGGYIGLLLKGSAVTALEQILWVDIALQDMGMWQRGLALPGWEGMLMLARSCDEEA